MRADEEMGAVARCATVAVSSSASTETVYDEVAVATSASAASRRCEPTRNGCSCPLGNCSRFEQCESTETVYVLGITTRLEPLLGFVQAAV